MSGPARAGALIYAKSLALVADFYRELLGMRVLHADADHQVLESADLQLIIHAIPPAIAATFTIAVPPAPREEQAIKLFFTVDSLAAAEPIAAARGGMIFGGEYLGPGFRARNGCDPEGNIFHLREPAP